MKKSTFKLLILSILLPIFSYSQSLELSSCNIEEYAVNDHHDSDNDGDVCETKLVLSKSASYLNDEICQLSNIHWTVLVDLDADGTMDLEYSSSLPSNDMTFDDTNGNGIPDKYIPTTTNNEIQNISLPDIAGSSSNHNITWSVTDNCNLGDDCSSSFSIQDKKAPTPYCVSGSTLVYYGNPIEIYVEDYDVGSFDNCSEQENLRFSFSGDSIVSTRLLTCDDVINSPVELRMYVWDDFDNVDYCTFYQNLIPGPTTDCCASCVISGTVKSWKGELLGGVLMQLDGDLVDFPKFATTNALGEYDFGIIPPGLDYTLSASFDNNHLSGVSTLDLVLIARHILEIEPFLNPYKIIASDINGDNSIKVYDVLNLRKLILGVFSELPSNKSWHFLRSDYEFSDPLDPFQSLEDSVENPFSYEFNHMNFNVYDFTGIKTGDINN